MSWIVITCTVCKTAFKRFNIPTGQLVVWVCAGCNQLYRLRTLVIDRDRKKFQWPDEANYQADDLRGGK